MLIEPKDCDAEYSGRNILALFNYCFIVLQQTYTCIWIRGARKIALWAAKPRSNLSYVLQYPLVYIISNRPYRGAWSSWKSVCSNLWLENILWDIHLSTNLELNCQSWPGGGVLQKIMYMCLQDLKFWLCCAHFWPHHLQYIKLCKKPQFSENWGAFYFLLLKIHKTYVKHYKRERPAGYLNRAKHKKKNRSPSFAKI